MAEGASEARRNGPKREEQREARDGREGQQAWGRGTGPGLTAAGGPQGDVAGQRDLCKGGYNAGVEPAGLPYQAVGCVWEREAFDGVFWKDLDGVFTCGLKAEKESGSLSYGDPCPSPGPCCPFPSPPLFPLYPLTQLRVLYLQGSSLAHQARLRDSLAHQERLPGSGLYFNSLDEGRKLGRSRGRSRVGRGFKAHPDLHVVVGIDEPGDIRRTLQDEDGVSRCATQFHRYGHCPRPAAGR